MKISIKITAFTLLSIFGTTTAFAAKPTCNKPGSMNLVQQ